MKLSKVFALALLYGISVSHMNACAFLGNRPQQNQSSEQPQRPTKSEQQSTSPRREDVREKAEEQPQQLTFELEAFVIGKGITRKEAEISRSEFEEQIRKSGSIIGDGPDDYWLWVKIRSELDNNERLAEALVKVDVVQGVVRLYGTVPTETLKEMVKRVVKGIKGVREVKVELKVGPLAIP